jgi:lycopene cyclase domain-containing protein
MSLYLILNLVSISVPFLVSFHPRIRLDKYFKALFAAIFLSLIPFIIWDIWFTESGYWGFNEEYLMGWYLLSLPIEEWMFFIAIPYSCVFTHVAIMKLFPNTYFSVAWIKRITVVLLVFFLGAISFNFERWYTLIDLVFAFVVLVSVYVAAPYILKRFYFTFLFMLIPFFIVNGILTGSGIEGEVVWYNNAENLGIRMGTIPLEDMAYAFSLILLNLLLLDWFTKRTLVAPPQPTELQK